MMHTPSALHSHCERECDIHREKEGGKALLCLHCYRFQPSPERKRLLLREREKKEREEEEREGKGQEGRRRQVPDGIPPPDWIESFVSFSLFFESNQSAIFRGPFLFAS